ncbi:hypothetical protein HK102_001437 [Quaeritorhiza haematococci]|nr:hypothetical protein HK102_001437 [Quaeritorhiza haematococci]
MLSNFCLEIVLSVCSYISEPLPLATSCKGMYHLLKDPVFVFQYVENRVEHLIATRFSASDMERIGPARDRVPWYQLQSAVQILFRIDRSDLLSIIIPYALERYPTFLLKDRCMDHERLHRAISDNNHRCALQTIKDVFEQGRMDIWLPEMELSDYLPPTIRNTLLWALMRSLIFQNYHCFNELIKQGSDVVYTPGPREIPTSFPTLTIHLADILLADTFWHFTTRCTDLLILALVHEAFFGIVVQGRVDFVLLVRHMEKRGYFSTHHGQTSVSMMKLLFHTANQLSPVNLEVKYPFIKSLIVDASFTPDKHTHYNSAMLLYHLSSRSFDIVQHYLEEGGRVDYFENFGVRSTLGQYVQRFEDDTRCRETLLLVFKLNFLDQHA